MKIKDLRIGNYIAFMEDDSIAKVIGIHINPEGVDVEFEEEETYIELREFCGITVNTDVLIKIGFEKIGHLICKRINNNLTLTYNEDSKKFFLSMNGFNTSVIENVEFVHQVQNLVFELTGEELEVNLK